MFEDLSEKLEATFARLRGRGVLSEADIKEGLREVRRVLLEADVNFQLTREFLERVEKKATGVNALTTVSPGQQQSRSSTKSSPPCSASVVRDSSWAQCRPR
jgi:signal recognition particle subunit SRP54